MPAHHDKRIRTRKPVEPKVKAAGLGGSITAGLITAIFAIFHVAVSQPVAALIASVLAAVVAFVAGYQKKA